MKSESTFQAQVVAAMRETPTLVVGVSVSPELGQASPTECHSGKKLISIEDPVEFQFKKKQD